MTKACVPEVVAGSTRRALVVELVDEDDVPVPLTGTSVRLQAGAPEDLAPEIDYAGVVQDAAGGVARFDGVGALVSVPQLKALRRKKVEYAFRVKVTDVAVPTIFDWTDEFDLAFALPPLETS